MSDYAKWLVLLAALTLSSIAAGVQVGREMGRIEGRHSAPMACEPKCTFTYRAGKLINVTCPDSTGAMP